MDVDFLSIVALHCNETLLNFANLVQRNRECEILKFPDNSVFCCAGTESSSVAWRHSLSLRYFGCFPALKNAQSNRETHFVLGLAEDATEKMPFQGLRMASVKST